MENEEKKLQNGTPGNEPEKLDPETLGEVTGGAFHWSPTWGICPKCGAVAWYGKACEECGTVLK